VESSTVLDFPRGSKKPLPRGSQSAKEVFYYEYGVYPFSRVPLVSSSANPAVAFVEFSSIFPGTDRDKGLLESLHLRLVSVRKWEMAVQFDAFHSYSRSSLYYRTRYNTSTGLLLVPGL
jgi:hypothetical protein